LSAVRPDHIFAVGTGTSYNACEAIAYTCRKLFAVPTTFHDSLDFDLDTPIEVSAGSLVIAISHSGGTLATTLAVKKAQALGAFTVGISANAASPLARSADYGLTDPNPYEGRPRGKTRSYHTSVMLGVLAAAMTANPGVRETFVAGAKKMLARLGEAMAGWEKAGRAIAAQWAGVTTRYLLAGFGAQKPNADEIGLKIIEVLGENATSYSLEELAHGPGASFRKDMGILLLQTDLRTLARCLEIARGIAVSEASLAIITDQPEAGWPAKAQVISLPVIEKPELFGLYPAAVAAQNLLYYLAVEKGMSPDENCRDKYPEVAEVSTIFFPPGTH
jgi:glucosamine 6-phosphate synthetase-like amidotransferase/phosphosugar isomerase protein